jgi:hypothetical protein
MYSNSPSVVVTTAPTTHHFCSYCTPSSATTTSLSLKLLGMSKRMSLELTNSPVTNSGGVGKDDYDDLSREEEDTGEEGNINVQRPAK